MKAFLTGSHVYGAPTEESDIDLVVQVDQQTYDRLLELGGGEVPLKFGKLNLIACVGDDTYMAWALGRKYCLEQRLEDTAPIPKEDAIAHHEAARDVFGVAYGEMIKSKAPAEDTAKVKKCVAAAQETEPAVQSRVVGFR